MCVYNVRCAFLKTRIQRFNDIKAKLKLKVIIKSSISFHSLKEAQKKYLLFALHMLISTRNRRIILKLLLLAEIQEPQHQQQQQ